MRRTLHVATLIAASGALAPACLLQAGPFTDDSAGGGGTGGTATTTTTATGGTTTTSTPTTTGGGGTGGMMSVCGDGLITGDEGCDDADTDPDDGCGPDCAIEPEWSCIGEPSVCEKTCGDGKLQTASGEACDDDNVRTGDGCNQGCQIEDGWLCTNPAGEDAPSVCEEACGNGAVDAGEQCDDAGTAPGDGCDDACQREQGWQCDNATPPSVCTVVCGDGFIVTGEETCDDGGTDPATGCNATCDGVVPGWECDPVNGGMTSCTTVCGDAIVVTGEACDDGNTDAYDGCGPTCQPEHTCGNGVVEPTEECDGNPASVVESLCDAGCQLEGANVCTAAPVITPAAPNPATGVRVTVYENNTEFGGVDVANPDVPSPTGCDTSFNNPVIHRYLTGDRPSIVTLETLLTQPNSNNADTFDNSQVWVYRDCPRKADLEGCNVDGADDGKHSKMTTGYLPAFTTLFIVVSGEGGGGNDKGNYALQITEQPVKLFFHEDFGTDTAQNIQPLPADLILDNTGDGGWITCFGGAGSPCVLTDLGSHSGGPLGLSRPETAMQTTSILRTPAFDLTGLTFRRAQYTFRFTNGTGNDYGRVEALDNGVPLAGSTVNYASANSAGRGATVSLPAVPSAAVQFTHFDDANAGAGTFSIDDLHIYGY